MYLHSSDICFEVPPLLACWGISVPSSPPAYCGSSVGGQQHPGLLLLQAYKSLKKAPLPPNIETQRHHVKNLIY